METKQWKLAQWGSRWRVSAVAMTIRKTSHVLDGHAPAVTPRNEEHLDQLIHVNRQITSRELCLELNINFSALETTVAMLEYCKVYASWVPRMLTEKQKNIICKFSEPTQPIRGWRWVSWIAMMLLYELQTRGPPLLVQNFMSAACKLLFIDGRSA
jgi:hypothetical protein